MFAATGTTPTFSQRVKPMIFAAFLAFSLMVGAGAAASEVGAAAPQSSQVTAQSGLGGTFVSLPADVAEKPKGGKGKNGKTATQTKAQEPKCIWYNQEAAATLFGETVGPEGYWDCYYPSLG
jgi:hypothetical protein